MNLERYSKELLETGKIPVRELLTNSVFYPACGVDGRPIKRFNPLYPEYGINSYVYVDYSVGADRLSEYQDEFRYYHVFASRELKRTDLFSGNLDVSAVGSLFTQDEKRTYYDFLAGNNHLEFRIFGRWIVYERNLEVSNEVGPERFSILYIGGEGAATYAALYLSRNMAPAVIAIINPGIAFGGNYICFRSIMSKVVDSGNKLPKYFLSGNDMTSAADCALEEYTKGIICLR